MAKAGKKASSSKAVKKSLHRAAKKPSKEPIKYERSLKRRNSLKLVKEFDTFDLLFEEISTEMEDFIKKPKHAAGKVNLPDSICSLLKKHFSWRPKTDEKDNTDGLGCSKMKKVVTNFTYRTLEISLVDRSKIEDTHKVGRGTMIKDFVYTGKSTIDPDGVGIFAAKTFKPGETIGVYLGSVSDVDVSGDYIMKRYGKWINGDKDKLFLGTHLANDYTWGMTDEQKTAHNKKGGTKRVNNSKCSGVMLHATKIIQIHEEIAFDYQL